MKLVTVEGTFPELKGGYMYQTARSKAGTVPVGVKLALAEIMKRHGVKRHRIKAFKLVVSVGEAVNGNP